jgi:dolichyl-phosphate-mannose-protein mannosyltransferase
MAQGSLGYKLIVATFTILALATRFYKISNGNFVLWDEAHFGKFGTHYIDGTFYFDVHPPLGKMLVGLAGRLSGYTGGYGFASGEVYPDNIPYVKMRMIIATFGSLCVPFSYILSKNLGFSDATSLMIGSLTLLEVGLIGITRLILLDSMLLFFGLAVMTFYTAFRKFAKVEEFSARWHFNLMMTGVSIGCVSSVKWVGFFITALVGLMTIQELWKMFGNWKISLKSITKHFIFRALYLIVVPISIYIFCFVLHFKFLFRSGPGNANMSSLFQASLEGTDLGKSPLNVAFGSKITIRSSSYGAGILHSHVQTYPEGSKQQQITLYGHSDENNDWIVHRSYNITNNESGNPIKKLEPLYTDEDYEVEFLKDGDHIRLNHNSTGKYLHSHFIGGRVTSTDFEVSGYGTASFKDPNDIWVVEVAEDNYKGEGQENRIVRSLFTQFRLKHLETGCYLRASGKLYPEWGFRHGEVSCKPNLKGKDLKKKEFLWNIELHVNSHLPEGKPGQYKSKFLDDLIEHNIGMWRTNNALIPDSELEPSALTSKPYHWMFLLRGLRMSGFGDDAVKFYMLGNPLIWWLSAISVTILLVLPLAYYALNQRNLAEPFKTDEEVDNFIYRLQVTVGGWAFNYLPYFLMGRVTYVHHYYPSLLFAILSLGFLFEHLTRNISKNLRNILAAGIILLAAGVFVHFAPMAYGFTGPVSQFAKKHKLLSSWNL